MITYEIKDLNVFYVLHGNALFYFTIFYGDGLVDDFEDLKTMHFTGVAWA